MPPRASGSNKRQLYSVNLIKASHLGAWERGARPRQRPRPHGDHGDHGPPAAGRAAARQLGCSRPVPVPVPIPCYTICHAIYYQLPVLCAVITQDTGQKRQYWLSVTQRLQAGARQLTGEHSAPTRDFFRAISAGECLFGSAAAAAAAAAAGPP
jgi:hypothetical protein